MNLLRRWLYRLSTRGRIKSIIRVAVNPQVNVAFCMEPEGDSHVALGAWTPDEARTIGRNLIECANKAEASKK